VTARKGAGTPEIHDRCYFYLTNKCTTFDIDSFYLLITLPHISMRKHQHQWISLYTNDTRIIQVKSIVLYRHHDKVEKLKYIPVLHSKTVTVLEVYFKYNQCSITADRVQRLYVELSVSGSISPEGPFPRTGFSDTDSHLHS